MEVRAEVENSGIAWAGVIGFRRVKHATKWEMAQNTNERMEYAPQILNLQYSI